MNKQHVDRNLLKLKYRIQAVRTQYASRFRLRNELYGDEMHPQKNKKTRYVNTVQAVYPFASLRRTDSRRYPYC